jgi:serine/threonine protein kinase
MSGASRAVAGGTVQVEDDYIQVGDMLADKYRVQAILGRGGMGMVVAVWHQDLHEHRAIKFMLPAVARDPKAVDRFMQEARAASKVSSIHAVKIHDVARLADGVPYIIMEPITTARSLRLRIASLRSHS